MKNIISGGGMVAVVGDGDGGAAYKGYQEKDEHGHR